MSSKPREFIGFRDSPENVQALEVLADVKGCTKTDVIRAGIQLALGQARAEGIVLDVAPRDKRGRRKHDKDLRQPFRDQCEAALADAGVCPVYKRAWIITELEDRNPADVGAVAHATKVGMEDQATALVAELVANFIQENQEVVLDYDRTVIWHLHRLLGTKQDLSYLYATIERMDAEQLWRHGRVLVKRLTGPDGYEIGELFERNDSDGTWHMIGMPQLHKAGSVERYFVEGPPPPPKQRPRMDETTARTSGYKSAPIGGKSRPRPVTRSKIAGDAPK